MRGAAKLSAGWWAVFVLASVALWAMRSDARSVSGHSQPTRMNALPRVTVWAWERREDLRSLDPTTTAVAYLDRTVVLDGRGVTVEPRRQPILLPSSSALVQIPVVRIETGGGEQLDGASAEEVASAVVSAAGAGATALQIDFDARRSERAWYRNVLTLVRKQMPSRMPLSMTALASWCSYDNTWMQGLPVDEAVPMLFRLEPDRRQAVATGNLAQRDLAIREPLCLGSVGISTHERWPSEMAGRRVYIFPDGGWQRDGLQKTIRRLR